MYTKKWSEMNRAQKIAISIMGSIQIGLLLAALLDIRRRAPVEINGSKRLWTALAFVNFIGPIAYFVWGRKREPA